MKAVKRTTGKTPATPDPDAAILYDDALALAGHTNRIESLTVFLLDSFEHHGEALGEHALSTIHKAVLDRLDHVAEDASKTAKKLCEALKPEHLKAVAS